MENTPPKLQDENTPEIPELEWWNKANQKELKEKICEGDIEKERAFNKLRDLQSKCHQEDKCWIWDGFHVKGTPRTTWKHTSYTVRKCIFVIRYGLEGVPAHLYSKCRRRKCVNPDHAVIGYAPIHPWYKD